MEDIFKVVIGGVIGAVLGPILLEKYRSWERERKWKQPRKELLLKMLNGKRKYRSLAALSRTIGTSDDDCRSLLIEIGARGAKMKSGKEAWVLISRSPLADEVDPSDEDE